MAASTPRRTDDAEALIDDSGQAADEAQMTASDTGAGHVEIKMLLPASIKTVHRAGEKVQKIAVKWSNATTTVHRVGER